MTDVITGVLSGGGYGLMPYSNPAKQDVSHTFIAIDIEFFMPLSEFTARMDAFIADIKAQKLRPGFTEILVPGEVDHRREQHYLANGCELDAEIYDQLEALAAALKIEFPFTREVIA
jgi:LDH2 family malate/lactate/ureidoglycolate dehydrogenase